ncbi:MAG: ABC transporter ATP-binding protein, partial [Planctomycetota bacterium]
MPGHLRAFRRPLALLAEHWGKVLLGLASVICFGVLHLCMVRLVGNTVDLLGSDVPGTLAPRIWLLVGVVSLGAVFRYLARQLLIKSSREVEARLKSLLMVHIGRLPLSWYERIRTGDLLSRLTQDVELVRFVVGPALLYGGQSLVVVPVGIYLMATLSTSVTLALCGVFACLLGAMAGLLPRMHQYSKRVQEDIADISQQCQEAFTGIGVILNFARAGSQVAALDRRNRKYLTDNMAMARFRALFHLFIHTCTDLVILAVLVLGAIEVIEGRMTLGGLLQFVIYMGIVLWPLLAIAIVLGVFHRARAAADRIEEVFQEPQEPRGGKQLALSGQIQVQDLTFRYQDQERPALSGVSFTLEPGQVLGLVGPVGAGKSTLLALLMRLYEPPRHTIFIDGHDILDLDPKALRNTIALAPQEPFLFSDTIEHNVSFGMSAQRLPAGEIETAIATSALDQDLDDLAEGLETIVGERGVTLSGGQKQRISLARALAADRQTLVLDDTLSAVDHATEARILEQLNNVQEHRTLLVAAHRLSAVRRADLILVLRDGEVVERGSHDGLLAANGLYARAFRLQREA